MTKEQYTQFMKAYAKARFIEITLSTNNEIDKGSWGASATTTIKLTWVKDGIESTYKAEFDGRITYAVGEQESIDNVGHVSYKFVAHKDALLYLFEGLSKTGDICFKCEITDTMRKTATRIEVTANVYNDKKTYYAVPVYSFTTAYAYNLTVTQRYKGI